MISYTQTDSEQERRMRMAYHNLKNLYNYIAPYIKDSFEDNGDGKYSDFDLFMKVNLKNIYCQEQHYYGFLKKELIDAGTCVFNNFQITQGSLPEIICDIYYAYMDQTTQSNIIWSNIQLGNLVIDDNTTVGEFAQAIVENNESFGYGDQITFVCGDQGGYYDIRFSATKVILEQNSNELLSTFSVLDNIPYIRVFKSYEGKLCFNMLLSELDSYIRNICFTWIHSKKENGKLLVSTQHLINSNTVGNNYAEVLYSYGYYKKHHGTTGEDVYYEDVAYLEPCEKPEQPVIDIDSNNKMYITAESDCDVYYTCRTSNDINDNIGIEPDMNDIGDIKSGHTNYYNNIIDLDLLIDDSVNFTNGGNLIIKAIAVRFTDNKISETSTIIHEITIITQQEI